VGGIVTQTVVKARFSICWCNDGATSSQPSSLCASCSNSRASHQRCWSPTRTIEPRIRTNQCNDASTRCKGSSHRDQPNAFYPFTPPFTTISTSSATSRPATRYASSEARHLILGELRQHGRNRPVVSLRAGQGSRDKEGWRRYIPDAGSQTLLSPAELRAESEHTLRLLIDEQRLTSDQFMPQPSFRMRYANELARILRHDGVVA
jgi:hypothetical protein